jgi:tetratricopeptide (TPR) repeat protein
MSSSKLYKRRRFIKEAIFILGALANVALFVQPFIVKWTDNIKILSSSLLFLTILINSGLWVWLLFLYRSKYRRISALINPDEGNRPHEITGPKYSKQVRRRALIGLFLLPIFVVGGISSWYYYNKFLPTKITVLVANFDGPDKDYGVTDIIYSQLEELEKTYSELELLPLHDTITAEDGSKRAIKEGIERDATIVIWGFYHKADDKVFVNAQFELLKKPQFLSLRREKETLILEASELKEFRFQEQLSKQMRYLTLLVVGLAHYEGEDIDGAIAKFTDALSLPVAPEQIVDPSIIYLFRGTSFIYKSHYDDAIVDFNKAIEINKEMPDLFNNRGLAILHKGDLDDALSDFNKALSIDPNMPVAYQNRGLTYIGLARYDDALSDFNKALELNPTSAPVYYNNLGIAFYYKEDYDNALTFYNKALNGYRAASFPPRYSSLVYHNLAWLFRDKGDTNAALNNYSLAISAGPDDPFNYISRGQFYNHNGEIDQAIDDYNEAIKLNPNSCEAYNDRGNSYKDKGALDQAINDYSQAIKVNDKCTYAYYNRGREREALNDLDGALADFSQLISLDPKYTYAYVNRGLVYRMKGQYADALRDYNEAIRLNSQYPDAYLNRGMLYKYMNQLDPALENFNQAIEINSDYADAYLDRGSVYVLKQELDNALSDFKKAQELGNEDTRNRAAIGIGLVLSLKAHETNSSVTIQK